MVDEHLIRRIDWFLLVVAGWFLLSLVVASFALMLFDVGVGLAALGTVVLVAAVGTLSYARTAGHDAALRVEIR
ncbi:hypothetical protein [Salinigranum salinum]|uniref:hypothetical protein n=1 Tax=Salinigranum salinum TaxID=1364937 RepID=UPI001260F997|nr:hypothetical protein [Salinigranum salinum]